MDEATNHGLAELSALMQGRFGGQNRLSFE